MRRSSKLHVFIDKVNGKGERGGRKIKKGNGEREREGQGMEREREGEGERERKEREKGKEVSELFLQYVPITNRNDKI